MTIANDVRCVYPNAVFHFKNTYWELSDDKQSFNIFDKRTKTLKSTISRSKGLLICKMLGIRQGRYYIYKYSGGKIVVSKYRR